jgi:hypothetical protein
MKFVLKPKPPYDFNFISNFSASINRALNYMKMELGKGL